MLCIPQGKYREEEIKWETQYKLAESNWNTYWKLRKEQKEKKPMLEVASDYHKRKCKEAINEAIDAIELVSIEEPNAQWLQAFADVIKNEDMLVYKAIFWFKLAIDNNKTDSPFIYSHCYPYLNYAKIGCSGLIPIFVTPTLSVRLQ